jgi:hypothetical protein
MRALATAVAVIASVLVASGCGGTGAKQTAHYTTMPPTTSGAMAEPVAQRTKRSGSGPLVVPISAKTRQSLEQRLYIARFLSPTRLAIPRIFGSSNCPSVPAGLIVQSPRAIRVNLVVGSWSRTDFGRRVEVSQSSGACLDDLHPVPVVISINPKQIEVHHWLKVSLYYPKGAIRRYKRPVVVTVPPLATARVRQEVTVARTSNPLFSIFPRVPGERPCMIPDGSPSPRSYNGICRTSVRTRQTHEPSVSVSFTESWWPHCPPMTACSPRALRHHTWQVIEGEPIIRPGAKFHIYATKSKGAKAPQLRWPRIPNEVQATRASSRYFSIFPATPSKRRCLIPDGAPGTKPFRGMCFTNVRSVVSHGPSAIVTFTERWGPEETTCPANGYCLVPYTHHATWQVSLGTTLGAKLNVLGTRLRGATPPQLYK